MTDPTPEDIAFAADLDRLRAHFGMPTLEQSSRRGLVGQDDPASCDVEDGA